MHQNTHQERYYNNRTQTEIGIPALTYQNHSVKQNGTMKSTTENSWQSSGHLQIGDTTLWGAHTQSTLDRITRTSRTSGQQRNSTGDRQDGACSYRNSTSN